jgi:DNA repair protein RadC
MHAKRRQNNSIEHLSGTWTVAELLITYKHKAEMTHSITGTEDAYELIKQLWDKERLGIQEQFMAFFFNRAHKLIGYKVISTGTMNNCIVDIRLLISLALHCLADAVIVAHNHPSGNLKPSAQDEVLTKRIKEALALVDVKLLDHFIVAQNGYTSFGEKGLL